MTVLNLQVTQGSDDTTRHTDAASWNRASTNTSLGYVSATFKKCGMAFRFQNVTIPKGSTISSAYLIVTSYSDKSSTTVNARIGVQDADNPDTFGETDDFAGRTFTTTPVDWDNVPAGETDTELTSPDIKTLIQAIVDRSGWASGNAIVLTLHDWDGRSTQVDDTRRQIHHYDGSSTYAPKLVITYIYTQVKAVGGERYLGAGSAGTIKIVNDVKPGWYNEQEMARALTEQARKILDEIGRNNYDTGLR